MEIVLDCTAPFNSRLGSLSFVFLREFVCLSSFLFLFSLIYFHWRKCVLYWIFCIYFNSLHLLPRTMATSQINNNNQKPVTFSAADFQRWNQTTSVVTIPQRLIRSSKIPQLRKEIIQAIGERKVAAVQALSPYKYRIEFRYSSDRHAADVNGISFRGIHLQPLPAYEEVKSIFVDRAPLQMQDNILFETLAPYGRVISIQHLKVKGFESVRSGTRRVSMVLTKAIPANINIGGFLVSFRYRGQPPTCFVCQEVGHTGKGCPKSRRAQKAAQQQQQQGGNNQKTKKGQEDLTITIQGSERTVAALTKKQQQVDLREKIDASRAAKLAPSKAAASRSTSQVNNTKEKEVDTLTDQSSQGAKAAAAKAVHSVTGEADPMDTCSPPSPPKVKREAGKAKGRSSKGAGVKVTAMDPQDEVTPSVPGEAGLRAVQSLRHNNPKISTSPPAHHLAAIRQVFGMSSPSDDLEPGEIRDSEPETDFKSLAQQAQSIANVATLATATPASFAYKGSARPSSLRSTRAKSVLVSAPEHVASGVAPPSVERFSFTLTTVSASSTHASASKVTSAWTRAYQGASCPPPCPPRRPGKFKTNSLQEDDDIPLMQRCKERKRRRLNLPPTLETVDECLSGASVVDPLNMDSPALSSVGGSEMPPVSSPWISQTIAQGGEMPPVSSPQPDSEAEAMLVSDPACHTIAPAEGSEMPPVSSPTINTNIGSGVTLTSDPTNNICTGPGVTSTPGPRNITNPGSGVTSTPDLTHHNNNLVEGSEIPPVSSPLSRLETDSTLDSLSLSSSVAAGDTNMGWQTPPPFHSSSFPSVVGGDESPFGSVLSTPEFLPSPASSTGRFEALIGGAPVAPVSQSEPEPLDTIDAINRAILTDPHCLQLLMELPEPSLESNNGSQDHIAKH